MKMSISYKKRSSRRTKGYLFISLLVNTIMIYRLSNGFADICKMLQMNGDNLCLGIKPISFLCMCVYDLPSPIIIPQWLLSYKYNPLPPLSCSHCQTFVHISPFVVSLRCHDMCWALKFSLFFPWHRE